MRWSRGASSTRACPRGRLAAVAILLASSVQVPGQDGARVRPAVAAGAATRRAIERGLEFLARTQNPNGSWTDRVGRKVHTTYRGPVAEHVGVTALAGTAFLAAGVLVDEGPAQRLASRTSRSSAGNYCQVLRRAVEYIMNSTGTTGFISAHGSRMYSHAFATLFLAEVYGTGSYRDNVQLRECLKRAVQLIVNAQHPEYGGWRYQPLASDADMSVTVCQVMALRAARNAGIDIPRTTIQSAVEYVRRSYLPGIGAFTYQLGPEYRGLPSRHSFALTAAGLSTLYGAGEYNAPEIREGLRYLWYYRPPRGDAPRTFDYYYGQYYAVQAAFQAGGEYWRRWYEAIEGDLVRLQVTDGRWPELGRCCWTDLVGPNYATAMAVIILQFPNQYLPISEN